MKWSKLKNCFFVVLLLFAMLLCGIAQAATVITPDNPNIQYVGRWDYSNPSAPWCHAKASAIIVNFQGTSIAMNFTFSSSNDSIRFILDDDGPGSVKLLRPDGLTTLASGLSDTNHKIEILKETSLGRITFNGLELDDGKSLNSPPARPPRKIEYYGDSIQVGLSLESERNDEDEALRGVYYNYTGITSRMFDAEFTNMSRSGATISQCHASYDRIDWNTSTPLWDFNNFLSRLPR
jgi:hypothetical protein